MRGNGDSWRKYRWHWKCAEKTVLTEKLIHYFRQIPDYRCGREKRHDLGEMLVCVPRIPLWPDNDPQEPEMVQNPLGRAAEAYELKIRDRLAFHYYPDVEWH